MTKNQANLIRIFFTLSIDIIHFFCKEFMPLVFSIKFKVFGQDKQTKQFDEAMY